MKLSYWWWIPTVVATIILGGRLAKAQDDEFCFMRTTSGERVSLTKVCDKSKKEEKHFMPKKVTSKKSTSGSSWDVELGGSGPQKLPNGDIVYPDGTTKLSDGTTLKIEFRDGVPIGFKHYDASGKLIN